MRQPALKKNIAQLLAGTRSPAHPEPGWFTLRLVRHGVPVPARIWSCPHEPGNPENLLDTGPILLAELGGAPADPLFIWERGTRVAESEYAWRMEVRDWAMTQEPNEPEASPRQAVDLGRQPSLF